MSAARTSREIAIEQVAILFPYLTISQRVEWWVRLDCDLALLTVNIPTFEERVEAMLDVKCGHGEHPRSTWDGPGRWKCQRCDVVWYGPSYY